MGRRVGLTHGGATKGSFFVRAINSGAIGYHRFFLDTPLHEKAIQRQNNLDALVGSRESFLPQ